MLEEKEILEIQNRIDNLQKQLDDPKAKNSGFHVDISNWEGNGIVSKSANIIVAPEDYWELGEDGEFGVVDGKKQYFTWDEAMAIGQKLGDGWRLPAPHEMMHLVAEFGLDENGEDAPDRFRDKLSFGCNGYFNYISGNLYRRGSYGYYWGSKIASGTDARLLDFSSTSLNPQDTSNKGHGFSVRLVKDLEDKNETQE